MSSIHDYKASLATVNNIFFKASSSDSGDHHFYERTLSFTDIQAITKTLEDLSWPLFFNHVRLILKHSELIFDSNSKEMIQLYFSKREGGISTPIDFTLPLVSNDDKLAISSLLFGFVERIQTLEMKLSTTEIASPSSSKRIEPVASSSQSSEMDTGVNAIGLVGQKAAASSAAETKKTGGSLLNPRAKKYVPKPTTLSGR